MPFLILCLMGAVLGVLYMRDKRRMHAARGAFFDRLDDVIDWPAKRTQPDGFPELRGSYRGYRVVLRATTDTLMARKLPSLWLEVSVLAPLPYDGVLSYLVRPCNTEFFSPSMRLPVRLEVPEDWPKEPSMLRCDDPDTTPAPDRLTPHMAICADRRMKEVLLTRRGVRLVYLADEGDRSTYLLLRQAQFSGGAADPALASRLLDAAIAVAEDLQTDAQPLPRDAQKPAMPDTKEDRHEREVASR
ncbi:hypothetical protein V6C03_00880 [Methyloligella sp. 2.7D]|uniref:hypothetical protein n=1 Tax=unclassified Methyloligella TaxID=2625955 RepID=UPI00157C7B9F|nr:hypothetical protein [Methyloligella sp. GL2]QKP76779.1 hypothetical protein HT051_04535 [Methyloligella sp. GL2]